jgi:CheY-like chemotaxis protein
MKTNKEIIIVLAEDDEGHATLIKKNLLRGGIDNEILLFKDGQETLDFFFRRGPEPKRENNMPYLLLLDIRMPKVDGVEVLRQIKQDEELRKMPVIMLTTTDDPKEVDRCHQLGCGLYITKPVAYDNFVEAIKQLGLVLKVVQSPLINGE